MTAMDWFGLLIGAVTMGAIAYMAWRVTHHGEQ
jgi:hypothetical protein